MKKHTVAVPLVFFILLATVPVTFWLFKASTVTYNDVFWKEVYCHDFRTDYLSSSPGEVFGWGNKTFTEEGLTINQGTDYCGTIFVNFAHNAEWIMETRVKVIESSVRTCVQILTRESNMVKDETGMGLYINSLKACVRHRIDGENLFYGFFDLSFEPKINVWYKIKVMFYGGNLSCYIDDQKVFEKSGLKESGEEYTEPHLAVFRGTAVFEYIKIWEMTLSRSSQ